ncbi:hypothetical protein NFI96_000358 [Prochilodus magdalenae]|nr:hypothetical protein NFI96_000358 [Prochilodus magdalenae]
MMNWFERVSEHLKTQQKPTKASVQLMEVFYEVSMSLCQSDVEGNSKILEILLLRFGAVVIDREVKFELRLEAIKTMNSMLDSASKGSRKNIYECDDYDVLLEEFANVIVDVGDYEMQVAVSEALCRMTSKKQREELAGKWFNYRSFASTFRAITIKEFETDCRIFLNELNGYFGNSKRVFSFPCTRAFLDFTELFKPENELLKEFWVDFNVGTSCIIFFVHDPVGTLWERIYLPKESLCTYSLRECDERKLLNVHMSDNISHGNTVGKMVQIVFDSKYDIQTAVEKVFGKSGDSPLPGAPENITPVPEDSGILADGTPKSARGRRIKVEDKFSLSISSDTERKLRPLRSESDSWAPSNERRSFKEKSPYDYSRKKPRLKSKLKVDYQAFEESEAKMFVSVVPETGIVLLEDKEVTLPAPITSLPAPAETMTQALVEDEESEMELGSGVTAAFNTFKTQLREHHSRFWQLESDAVKAFCDKQQKRLDSLDIPKESGQGVPESQAKSTEASTSVVG